MTAIMCLKTMIGEKKVDIKCWMKLLFLDVKAILYEYYLYWVIDLLRTETSK